MCSKKKQSIDYLWYKDYWKDYLISKGFSIVPESEYSYNNQDFHVCLIGCCPEIRIEILAGDFRTDTETKGCIAGDFNKCWNKVSQCPIYFDLNVSEAKLWKAIEMLINVDPQWSNYGGQIIEQSGSLEYDPPIFNLKEKQRCVK